MTTTKEFKTLHGLSDSAFNRLTNKIKAEYPEQELTRRIGSRDWKIVDIALFERYLTYQKRDASPVTQAEAPQTRAIVLPNLAAMMAANQPTEIIQAELVDDYNPSALAPVSSGVSLSELRQMVEAATALADQQIARMQQQTEAEQQEQERLRLELARLEARKRQMEIAEIDRTVAAESASKSDTAAKVIQLSDFFARRAGGGKGS